MASVMDQPVPRGNVAHAQNLPQAQREHNDGSSVIWSCASTLLDFLLRPLRSLTGAPDICPTSETAASKFIHDFETNYGRRHPNFVVGSAEPTFKRARERSSFFLIYLHSAVHDDTDSFCKRVLGDEEVVAFMDENFVVWGGDVSQPEAYSATRMLQVASFPFLGLLVWPAQHPHPIMLLRIDGGVEKDPEAVIKNLKACMVKNANFVVESRRVQQEREERRRLREEQEREYNESLVADREKEERLRREADERTRLAQQAEEEASLKEAMELSKQLTRQQDLEEKKARVLEEPPSGPETTRLQLKLPNGKKLLRRFPKRATLLNVRDFIDTSLSENGMNGMYIYSLNLNFPKRTFYPNDEDNSLSMENSGLHPQAVLFIHNLNA